MFTNLHKNKNYFNEYVLLFPIFFLAIFLDRQGGCTAVSEVHGSHGCLVSEQFSWP